MQWRLERAWHSVSWSSERTLPPFIFSPTPRAPPPTTRITPFAPAFSDTLIRYQPLHLCQASTSHPPPRPRHLRACAPRLRAATHFPVITCPALPATTATAPHTPATTTTTTQRHRVLPHAARAGSGRHATPTLQTSCEQIAAECSLSQHDTCGIRAHAGRPHRPSKPTP